MKSSPDEQFRELCQHIVEWGDRIPTFIGTMSYDDFVKDDMAHLAVWKCVEVLGEASFRILKLDDSFDGRHPRLQLRDAYSMRNRLTHGYSDVDLLILWNTIHNFIPAMVDEARAILGHSDR